MVEAYFAAERDVRLWEELRGRELTKIGRRTEADRSFERAFSDREIIDDPDNYAPPFPPFHGGDDPRIFTSRVFFFL